MGAGVTPILKKRKPRHGEVKQLFQDTTSDTPRF